MRKAGTRMLYAADVAIVGAGVVGLAVARRLVEKYGVIVIDKNLMPCNEASRYNSGVIHSGIHLEPTSLKAEMARVGSKLVILYCGNHNIPFRKCGMIVGIGFRNLWTLLKEWRTSIRLLMELRRRAFLQNIPIKILTWFGVRRIERAARVIAGVYIPDVWIIDQESFCASLFRECRSRGVTFALGEEVLEIKIVSGKYIVVTNRRELEVGILINSAGINSDIISAMAGVSGYKITPWRGEYYEVVGSKKDLIFKTLVYPALRPGSLGLGIHITKAMDGRLLLGPNAKSFPERQDDFGLQSRAEEFLKEARCFLPQLEESDLRWAFSGLRAKSYVAAGESDFIIKLERTNPCLINLIGIESPGLTASLAIAERVASLLEE